jgi:neutral ceramidase
MKISVFLRSFVPVLFLAAAARGATPAAPAADWKAGTAVVDITPEMPMWMAGYGARTRPGDQVAQRLHAKGLALEDARGHVAVLVTTDTLGIPRLVRTHVEQRVAAQFKLPPSSLLINASHTHTGPEIRVIDTSFGREDKARLERVLKYRQELENKLVQVVGEALAHRAPAGVAFGQAQAGFAMNRRENYTLPKGDLRAGKVPNPDGPVDHDVPVLQVTDGAGKLVAVLFGYACHNTTLDGYAFTGDYAGFAQAHLEASHPGAVAMFMSGCSGDQNPHPRRDMIPGVKPLELASQHGRTLANAVEAALQSFPRPLAAKLESVLEDVALDYQPVPTREELQQQLNSADRTTRENAQVNLEMLDRDGRLPTQYPYAIQLLRVGQLTLVGLASEVVVDYSLRLKRELPGPLWVSAYNNDFMGYMPSKRVWLEGGYEGGGSLVFTSSSMYRGAVHPNIWAPTLEERIVAKVHELNARLPRHAAP